MFSFLYTLFATKNPSFVVLKWILLLALLLVCLVYYKKMARADMPQVEAFTQDKPFVLKRGQDTYDEFYVEVYDRITNTESRGDYELKQLIKATEPSTEQSVFLDIGSGTGYIVHELQEAGFQAYGIDESKCMVDYSQQIYPEVETKCGNAMDSMLFERGIFTHILCTYFTIYHMEDKNKFFQNCRNWLKPNGYLFLHIVDKDRFDTIMPVGKPTFLRSPQKYAETRITETKVEFDELTYTSSYQFGANDQVVLKETFTDHATANIRQNERTLIMEPVQVLLEMGNQAGFVLHSKATVPGDEYQYLYILERI
jgi:SAM-dependent methyltransferase